MKVNRTNLSNQQIFKAAAGCGDPQTHTGFQVKAHV